MFLTICLLLIFLFGIVLMLYSGVALIQNKNYSDQLQKIFRMQ
ncbi:hypothetical protein [Methanobrevibacter sp.]|nr:hypothetical protein [Methanobrevibacter sp.]